MVEAGVLRSLLAGEVLTHFLFFVLDLLMVEPPLEKALLEPKMGGEEQMTYKPEDLRRVILRETVVPHPAQGIAGQSDQETNAAATQRRICSPVSFEIDPEIMEVLVWVGIKFIRCVVGDQRHQENVRKFAPFWDWVTDSDLAFALMTLDEYCDAAEKELEKRRNRNGGGDSAVVGGGGGRQVGGRKAGGSGNKKGSELKTRYLVYRNALHKIMQDENGDKAKFMTAHNAKFEQPAYDELNGGVPENDGATDDTQVMRELSENEQLSNYLNLESI